MISLTIRAAVLWASLCGYFLLLKKKNIDMAFAPIIVTSSIGVLIFFAGLLNIMPMMTYAICIGGIVIGLYLRPWHMFKEKQISTRDVVCVAVFTFICLLFAIRVKGVIGLHYDNFSHWLTVITEMVKTDSLPNFKSPLVVYQGYPTGSAGFAYYFCKIFNHSDDGIMLFAQSVLIASCLMTFFAFVRKVNVISIVTILLGSIYCLVANIFIDQLLVDTLISVLAIAAIAIIVYYKDNLKQAAFYSAPIQIYLIAVKNSGIVFVLFNAAFLLILYLIDVVKGKNKVLPRTIAELVIPSIGLPFGTLYLWTKHVEYAFTSGITTMHSATVDNYKQMLGRKSIEDIITIIETFVDRFLSFGNAWVIILIIASILAVGFTIRRMSSKTKTMTEVWILAGVLTVYVGFMGILAIMYLLSMPTGEALYLAGYSRYEKQVLLYLVGIVVIYLLCALPDANGRVPLHIARSLTVLLVGVILLTQYKQLPKLYEKKDTYSGSLREIVTTIRDEYALPEGAKYFIYGDLDLFWGGNSYGYTRYLSKYVLWSPNVTACNVGDLPDYQNQINKNEYLIVLTENDSDMNEWLVNNDMPIGETVYKLSDYQ